MSVRSLLATACAASASFGLAPGPAQAASFVFAEFIGQDNLITHPIGYDGIGTNLTVTVGINPASTFATDMEIPVENAVNTFNAMIPTLNNVQFGVIGNSQMDFESVFIHELGHSLGLAHVNTASESGLSGANRRYTKSRPGVNNTYDLDPGADGVIGSADDVRGDDTNLIWFNTTTNDPFDTNLGVVDSTTYSQDISQLPSGDLYPAIAHRDVATLMGLDTMPGFRTEAVMVQGSFFGEIQRSLAAQDVAGLMYARTGYDSLQGTADDYTVTLQYVGQSTGADITVQFDNDETGFGTSVSSGSFRTDDDIVLVDSNIYFNTEYNWVFNDVSNNPRPIPLPASGVALGFAIAGFGALKLRGAQSAA